MPELRGRHVLIFHAGALGDFVLTWPLVKALQRGGAAVTVVARDSHANLARRVLNVGVISQERSEVAHLWRESGSVDGEDRARWAELLESRMPDAVVTFAADPATEAGARWMRRVHDELRPKETLFAGPPGTSTRASVWTWAEVHRPTPLNDHAPDTGRPVVHIGAGGRDKLWPMPRWRELIETDTSLRGARIIGGEVEAEWLSAEDRRIFEALRGTLLHSLDQLVDLLTGASDPAPAASSRAACLFVGADTGPTHLAAQLGVPTLALFGPTDPAIWSPIGPHVHVVRDPGATMQALSVEHVRLGLSQLADATRAIAQQKKSRGLA